MQAENFAPSAAFPTLMPIWKCPPPEPGNGFSDPDAEPFCVVVVTAAVDESATLATPGELEPPPPQPAASNETAAAASATPRTTAGRLGIERKE
jgi:hypothetical protein